MSAAFIKKIEREVLIFLRLVLLLLETNPKIL
nr:MAG TPA: hypothetical protein [Caudoviricetes sp.]